MTIKRRQFVKTSLLASSLSLAPSLAFSAMNPAKQKLKILFLGGTGFLGPHTVQYAIERGHEVTLFNRGKTNSDLFPQLKKLKGNRDPEVDEGLVNLKSGEWDAVIDTSGFVPRIVEASSKLLANRVKHYLFISTLCVYDNWAQGGLPESENRPLIPFNPEVNEDVGKYYCELKAYSEMAANQSMPGRVTNIRPGFIVGPRDKKNRFYYFPVRINQGGEVIAPGKPEDLTQFIDVRDLARFIVLCLEKKLTGDFNLVAPQMTFGNFLTTCNQVSGNKANINWIPTDFLAKHDIYPWRDLPMWADSTAADRGMVSYSSQKAIDAGLTFTPLADTIKDTLDYYQSLPAEAKNKLQTAMTREKESAALAAWKANVDR